MQFKAIIFFVFPVFIWNTAGYAQPDAQWRGINRDGIYNSAPLLKSWPDSGPSLLWSVEDIGTGYGSPVVANNILYVNGEINYTGYLFAFDLKGQLLWKSANGKEYPENDTSSLKYSGPRSTPTVAGNLVYTCSGLGRIACLNAQTGAEVWAADMVRDFKGLIPEAGYAESLLVDGEVLYCFPGGLEKNAAALNRFTGETIWTSKAMSDSVSFCSPLIINLASRKILVNITAKYIFGLDTHTGQLLWSQKQENVKQNQQCATPVFADGYIYYISGVGNGAVKLELSPGGESIREIWRIPNSRNGLNSPVKINEFLYFTDTRQKLKCIDINRGIVVDSLRIIRGPLAFADNMFYCYSENGQVSLIKLAGSRMEVVSKFKIEKGTREHLAHPLIDKGVMYIRHGNALMAYDISDPV